MIEDGPPIVKKTTGIGSGVLKRPTGISGLNSQQRSTTPKRDNS